MTTPPEPELLQRQQDGVLWLSSEMGNVSVSPQRLYGSGER